MIVKVARLGEQVKEVDLGSGGTVEQAISGAGSNPQGTQVRVNGEAAEMSATLRDGDVVTLVPQIKGGR